MLKRVKEKYERLIKDEEAISKKEVTDKMMAAVKMNKSPYRPFGLFANVVVTDLVANEYNDRFLKFEEYKKNYQEKITVDELTTKFSVGRRNFERRFKKATSNTVVEYIQRVKIEAAKMSLESSRENVNEVMYDVGYLDNKAFRTIFKKITGLSPVEYRNKYNKEGAVA
jgi:AraC-like DNA-binding protein